MVGGVIGEGNPPANFPGRRPRQVSLLWQTWHENETYMLTWFAKNHIFSIIVPINWIVYIIICYALGLWTSLARTTFLEMIFRENRKFRHVNIGPSLYNTNIYFFVYVCAHM